MADLHSLFNPLNSAKVNGCIISRAYAISIVTIVKSHLIDRVVCINPRGKEIFGRD
jgi:hypothetical protein